MIQMFLKELDMEAKTTRKMLVSAFLMISTTGNPIRKV